MPQEVKIERQYRRLDAATLQNGERWALTRCEESVGVVAVWPVASVATVTASGINITRLEVERSSPVSHRWSRRMGAAHRYSRKERLNAAGGGRIVEEHRTGYAHSSRWLIPSLETFAYVISSGIQSGELSGAVSSHAQPS